MARHAELTEEQWGLIRKLLPKGKPREDGKVRKHRIKLVSPYKCNRVKKPTQDGRTLRRYKRRWKIERLFSWLQSFRRVQTRWEFKAENFMGMVRPTRLHPHPVSAFLR